MSSHRSISYKNAFEQVPCSVCGKKFIPAVEHVFKIRSSKDGRTTYQCCYTCFKKAKEASACRGYTNRVERTSRKKTTKEPE